MDEFADIELTVNGEKIAKRVEARQHLVDFLRIELGLTGSHLGCEHGVCAPARSGWTAPSCAAA